MRDFGLGLGIGIIVACIVMYVSGGRNSAVKPKEVAVIQKQITHRNDTVRIIDSAVHVRKLQVQKLSKPEVRTEFDATFALDEQDTVIKHDTLVVTVEQAKQCLELKAQHDGDSAKLTIDNRTLAIVDSNAAQITLNPVQKTNWSHIGLGALGGALFTLLVVIGVR